MFSVSNFEGEVVIGKHMKLKHQLFDNRTFGIADILVLTNVIQIK